MNERIKELFFKAGANENTIRTLKSKTYFDPERFAELIVRECIDIVAAGGEFASRPKLVEKLQEHLRIEE